jgi:cyclophilin family peptidyl-prolyl cis-trans isomerase
VSRPLALLLCALALALAACGGDDEADSPAPKKSDSPATTAGGCTKTKAPTPKPDGGAKKPSGELKAKVAYDVVLKTNCGSFTIRVDQAQSPKTAASFVSLAREGFFDGTTFHRIVPGFVIQGGDPTGTGTGGPGYFTRDVPAPDTNYTKGTVAMAKTQTEPAGTAGSQFYVVTAPDAGLPADYAVLGAVVEGQNVVDRIAKLGDPNSGDLGTPLEPVVVESATVQET